MPLQTNRRTRYLYLIAALIAVLLLGNAVLMYRNSQVIEENLLLEAEADKAKVNNVAIIRDVHLLDLGIRGYVLTKDPAMLASADTANRFRHRIVANVESALRKQNYPYMKNFYEMRDSIDAYFHFIDSVRTLAEQGNDEVARRLIEEDRGYFIWLRHKAFTAELNGFEDTIMAAAAERYQRALRRTYVLQLVIFLLTVPAIFYMAIYASRTFVLSDKLRRSEHDRNRILTEQNETLDRLVREKTKDIQTQNEEIIAQNEEIVAQNEEIRAHNDQLTWQQDELRKAKSIIEEQSRTIENKNRELTQEVANQMQDLREANNELIAYNTRLEQFTYIISHNLRAPLARLKGLANVMEHTSDNGERDRIYQMMVQSSYEFDNVISDLGTILSVERSNTLVKTAINLNDSVQKVLASLKPEIDRVNAQVTTRVEADASINCLAPYVESILHNLISNAIKYRDPERPLSIQITSTPTDNFVAIRIADNGLGIDLEKHGNNLFSLYKRFHFHVEGKGLGLYLVKTQIDAIGGKIEVESKVNKGSAFVVYFPR